MPTPTIRDAASVQYETVDAADGLSRGVLIGADHGAPNFASRRFTLDPGANVPKHTNEVEHVQYVLDGSYVVGIEGTDGEPELGTGEHRVTPGDSLLIPSGTVHWYRNMGDKQGAFLCAVPHGDDEIELVEE